MATTSSVIEKPAAHTRGPWIVSGYSRDRQLCIEQGGYAVAYACPRASSPASGPQYYEREANARVIAAAPDLLAVARSVEVVYAELATALPTLSAHSRTLVSDAIGAARAAIAKAEAR